MNFQRKIGTQRNPSQVDVKNKVNNGNHTKINNLNG